MADINTRLKKIEEQITKIKEIFLDIISLPRYHDDPPMRERIGKIRKKIIEV